MNETKSVMDKAVLLDKLGFKKASMHLVELSDKKRKLALAYEHFRFVRQEKIDAFNNKLMREKGYGMSYKELSFTSIESYKEVPPEHVLTSLGAALEFKCFDSFEVAHIVEVKDPILFGRIKNCSDRFFIDQWDDDVKIEDILMPNEG